MKSTTLLTILQTFLMVLGALGALWGMYDMFGEGQQTSVGVKKLVGGLAFAALSYFIMKAAIQNVSSAEAKAGISACILPAISSLTSGMLHFGR
jgi:hypothetical protein